MAHSEMLSEPWTFHFPYTRTTGAVVGTFLAALREQRIVGLRMKSSTGVLVPPHPYDPKTSESLEEWVEVATEGTVTSWTWVAKPLANHPFDRPFAFGLITLDGAATGMFHTIDAPYASMKTGMRVRVRWARQLRGHITDIRCFEPCDASAPTYTPEVVLPEKETPPERMRYEAPFSCDYTILAGKAYSVFLKGLRGKKLLGMRGPSGNVLIPPDGADPMTGHAVTEVVELPDTGSLVRYCVVNIPVRDQQIELPFVAADILLDGADSTFMALIQNIKPDDIRLGLRVRAVWVEESKLTTSMSNIKWFEPTGEPDADLATLEDYL